MSEFEMGGYLPLELSSGCAFFRHTDPAEILAVNTGRTALRCAIDSLGVHRVCAPAFYCPDILAMLRQMDIELSLYRMGPDFRPLSLPDDPDTAVILVNYFGVTEACVQESLSRCRRAVIDNAHAFFVPPVLRSGVMNVYSCRKFVGVCDGAYLIGQGIRAPGMERDVSYPRSMHLLQCCETGTNGAYALSRANEEALDGRYLAMSRLTERLLDSIDYDAVRDARRRNFLCLHRALSGCQLLSLRDDGRMAPYMYPLLLDRDLHRALVERHIYVPVLWSQLLSHSWDGSVEQRYSRNIVPLPIDQRYSAEDMAQLAQIVQAI